MVDLSTTFSGLKLKSPVIVGSSGLTGSVEKIKKFAENGAGAVVLKSIFEEEIYFEHEDIMKEARDEGVDMSQFDYYDFHLKGRKLEGYVDLVKNARKAIDIPLIASVNCVYSHEWTSFARRIEQAGADAIELNMFFLPSDFTHTAREQEQAYFKIIEAILKAVSIPVILKISYYFSSLGPMIQKLSRTGAAGLVLFNRFYSPDIDIENLSLKPSFVFSTPSEIAISLRWIAIMAKKTACDLAASTGVHDAQAVIKQILAGAKAVQMVSCLYRNGPGYIATVNDDIRTWMQKHDYRSVADFCGVLSQDAAENPAVYERVQFMRYFGGSKDPE